MRLRLTGSDARSLTFSGSTGGTSRKSPRAPRAAKSSRKRLIQRYADAPRGLTRIAGEVLQVAVVEVGEVVDEGETQDPVAPIGRQQENRVEADGPPVEQHVGDAVDRIGLVREGRPEQVAGLGKAAPVDIGRQLEEPAESNHSGRLSCIAQLSIPCIPERPSYAEASVVRLSGRGPKSRP